jgi:hypothetical protein
MIAAIILLIWLAFALVFAGALYGLCLFLRKDEDIIEKAFAAAAALVIIAMWIAWTKVTWEML